MNYRAWQKHNKICKPLGTTFASVQKIRTRQNEIIGDLLISDPIRAKIKNEKRADSKNGFIEEKRPLVRVNGLCKLITDTLDTYKKQNLLSPWEDCKNEVWLKFGGDHGGESFKFTMQILNIDKPNTISNTLLILCPDCPDNYSNLTRTIIKLQSDIEEVKKLTWNGHRTRMFPCGDYKYLAELFGLSGASGVYFCLWCLCTQSNMQHGWDDQDYCPKRSLSKIKNDYKLFQERANGNKVYAHKYNNCIHMPLVNVHIRNVSVPRMHIKLCGKKASSAS